METFFLQGHKAEPETGVFLDMLAHELRNPLVPIRNAAHLMKMIAPDEPRLVQLQDIITRQVAKMTEVIDDLVDSNYVAQGRMALNLQSYDLSKIARATAADIRDIMQAENRTLKTEIPDTPVFVNADPARVEQVLRKLLDNAYKFTNPGGIINLSVRPASDQVTIVISDNGIGIDPAALPSIFEGAQQASLKTEKLRGGLGLGLGLAKGLIDLHGGTISVTSDGPGKGTACTITLPLDKIKT